VVTNERKLGKDRSQAGHISNGRSANEMAQRSRGGARGCVQRKSLVTVEKGVSECRWRRVLAKNGCAQLHVFTRIYTLLHKISGGNVTSDKIRASRQDLPVRELPLRSSHSRGATFRRLSPPSVAFSDGEGWKKVPRTGLNAGPELRETMWISLAGHERIIIKIRIAIKRLFSQSAVDTWPTFATLGPSIFATQSPINGAMNRN